LHLLALVCCGVIRSLGSGLWWGLFPAWLLILLLLLTCWLAFFQSFSIPQSVECVVSAGASRADTSQHQDFYFFTRLEGITQHHRQLGATERHMLTLNALDFCGVNSSDTFFKPQERLVDLSTFSLSIFIITDTVSSSLTASQVDQEKFTALLNTLFLDLDLANGM